MLRAICVGRLAQQKGFALLLEAVAAVPQSTRNRLRIDIVGEGPDGLDLRDRAQALGVTSTVGFAGFSANVDAWYRQAELVILPSRWEGLSITLLEAMAHGRAVIASNIEPNMEVLNGTAASGRTFHAQSVDALRDAIDRAVCDRSSLSSEGLELRERYQTRYTVDIMTESYLDLYRSIIGQEC